jgi:threonine synthase
MLSPFGRMSLFQRKQMYTNDDLNVFNLVPNGNFDECQAAVKLVNSDADFKRQNSIGAMNSINWARIMAQVVYYVYGYVRTVQYAHDILTVVVPSGNFGNALAAYVAAKMGLPIRIIVATNENDVLHQFFKTGVYSVRNSSEVITTLSPSMDIASASNFERFMFDYVDRDTLQLKKLWRAIDTSGSFTFKHRFTRANGGVWISSGSATDAEVLETIRTVFNCYGIIVDPHTAVALKVGLDQCRRVDLGPILFAETAQPAKFAEVIKEALGITMPIPVRNRAMFELKEKVTRIEETDPFAIADAVKKFMIAHSR